LTKIVNLQDRIPKRNPSNQDMIDFFGGLYEHAKQGKLSGFAGVVYYEQYEPADGNEPSVGTIHSFRTHEDFYMIMGGLEQVKHEMLECVYDENHGED